MFFGTVTNNLDSKGRISVPSSFRAVVARSRFEGIHVWSSLDGHFIDGADVEFIEGFRCSINELDYYDKNRTALAESIFADGTQLSFDNAGRVSLPRSLLTYAGLSDQATFVGLGSSFQIWAPQAYQAHREVMRALARENRHLLRSSPRRDGGIS